MTIDAFGLIRFFMQLGLVTAGGAALWGWFFSRKSKETAEALLIPLVIGLLFFFGIIAGLVLGPAVARAHEGISLQPAFGDLLQGASLTALPAGLVIIITVLGLLFYLTNRQIWLKRAGLFYGSLFLLLVFIISFQHFSGSFNQKQIFLILHNFHSILTLGTVLMVDFLFIIASLKRKLAKFVYSGFVNMSLVIWLGLGIDFLSVYPVFGEALVITPKFYFAQTLIAVLIIVGVFLSGPVTRILRSTIKSGKVLKLTYNQKEMAGLLGSISVVSWLTITFIDFFPELNASYWLLLAVYLIAVFLVYLFQHWFHKYWA